MIVRVAVLSIVLTGCSFVFVQGAPDLDELPRGAPVECTNSDLWPMIDAVLAGGNTLGLTLLSLTPTTQQNFTHDTFVGVTIVGLVVHTVSAIYGFVRTNSCQDVLSRVARQRPNRFRIVRPQPPAPPPPPPPTMPARTTEEDSSPPDGGQP